MERLAYRFAERETDGGAVGVDETIRKELALEYCRRINAADLEGTLALFGSNPRFEDPIGRPHVGREAVRTHLARAIAGHAREEPGEPVAAFDGRSVFLPVTVTVADDAAPPGKRVRITMLSLLCIGPARTIEQVVTFWGRSDVCLVDY